MRDFWYLLLYIQGVLWQHKPWCLFASRCNHSFLYLALTRNLSLSDFEAIYHGPHVSCASTSYRKIVPPNSFHLFIHATWDHIEGFLGDFTKGRLGYLSSMYFSTAGSASTDFCLLCLRPSPRPTFRPPMVRACTLSAPKTFHLATWIMVPICLKSKNPGLIIKLYLHVIYIYLHLFGSKYALSYFYSKYTSCFFFKYHTGSKRMVFKLRFLKESNFQFVTNQKYQAVPSLDLLFWFIRLFSSPI